MKKIITLVFCFIALMGCKDFLEYPPYGIEDGSATFWTSQSNVEKAINSLNTYTWMEGVSGRGFMWFENCSDNMVTGRTQAQAQEIKNFQMSPNNGRDANKTWPAMYQSIAKCNEILRNVKDMSNLDSKFKDFALGQAYFYRGFAYLFLAPFYGDNGPNGGIPIITETTPTDKLDMPRPQSVLENYDMIIADMEKAGELLPLFSVLKDEDYGRPHKVAAWAYAARAALYASRWDVKYLDIVLDYTNRIETLSGADKRELFPDFTRLFRPENNWSSEYIFSWCGNAQEGPKFHGMSFQNGGWGLYNTWGFFAPTLELYKAYEQGDVRRDATILYPGSHITFIGKDIHYGVGNWSSSSTSGMLFRKWMSVFEGKDAIGNAVNSNSDNASNILCTVLMRYADVLLMRAEALIWKNGEGNDEAISILNKIRKRAHLPENSKGTKAELKQERRCELAFEFQPSRHIDLVRWGDAQSIYAKPLHGVRPIYNDKKEIVSIEEIEVWPARKFDPSVNGVFPIPQKEINNSKNLKQNIGY